MRQKGFAPIIILVLVALTIVGYFGYKNFWPKLKNLAVSSSTPTASRLQNNDISSWRTYIHPSCGTNPENFKFIIRLPPDFTENDRSNERGYSYFVYSKDGFDFEISCGAGHWDGCGYVNKEIGGNFIINNEKTYGCLERNESKQTIDFMTDYWSTDNRLPRIFFTGEAKDTPENISLINQILSTFKFTR